MTDHEIHLALARFMGWTEMPASPYQLIPRGFFAVTQDPESEPTIWRGLAPSSTHEPWTPTRNSAQAVEVIAEAMRKRWSVEAEMSATGHHAHCRVFRWIGEDESLVAAAAEEFHGSPEESWCRAVCRAITEAISTTQPGEST